MYKFFIITIVLSVSVINGFSQIKKGTRMAGASIGTVFYNSGKTEYSFPPPTTGYVSNNKNYGISLGPSMGWFISDNTAVGASVNFAVNNSKTTDVSDATGNTFNKDNSNRFNIGIGGFARNYFKTEGNLLPFGQVNLSFGTGTSKSDGFNFIGSDKYTYKGKSSGDSYMNAGLSFGITKMLNNNIGLDLFAGYNYSRTKSVFKKTTLIDLGNNGTTDQTSISEPTMKYSNHGAIIGVSFQIFLDKKK